MEKNRLKKLFQDTEKEIKPIFYNYYEDIALTNQDKILKAFKKNKVSEYHLKGSTGYGYNDAGRQVLENVYAEVFGAESALVRGQISSGTHAIALCLFGVLKPQDKLLSLSGTPYDTLQKVIGISGDAPGTLVDWGVKYEQVDVLENGKLDWEGINKALDNDLFRMVMIQRSKGYSLRNSVDITTIKKIIGIVKQKQPSAIIFVDNCYGEFVESLEPTDVGADLIAGSLIKNPGGALAPTGGYVIGKSDLVDMAASRLTAPGVGGEVGASLGWQRLFYQGLFEAPSIVKQALKGAIYTARLFEKLDFDVVPLSTKLRTDIVQGIIMNSADMLIKFCQAIQNNSPVDSHVLPEPWDMPGYDDQVIMAAGTFIHGASLELTADGPLRPPYVAYFQGGLTYEHTKIAAMEAAKQVTNVRG